MNEEIFDRIFSDNEEDCLDYKTSVLDEEEFFSYNKEYEED